MFYGNSPIHLLCFILFFPFFQFIRAQFCHYSPYHCFRCFPLIFVSSLKILVQISNVQVKTLIIKHINITMNISLCNTYAIAMTFSNQPFYRYQSFPHLIFLEHGQYWQLYSGSIKVFSMSLLRVSYVLIVTF